jgi:hypothetical protein
MRLFHRCAFVSFLSAAIAAVMVIAPLPARVAHAAAPTVAASALCRGNVGSSTDSTDLPPADLTMNIGFLTPGVSPAKKPPDKVNGLFSMSINGTCAGTGNISPAPNPCVWAGTFTGTEDKNGNMTLTFGDLPAPFTTGSDILDGCQWTFLVMPYSKNASAAFIGTSLLTQAPTSPPTCKPAGARIVLSCTLNNN